MRTPNIEDIIYDSGFPSNINFKKKVIIQITASPVQSVILYMCKITDVWTRSYLPISASNEFQEGIYDISQDNIYTASSGAQES